jgi:hypothetical protein
VGDTARSALSSASHSSWITVPSPQEEVNTVARRSGSRVLARRACSPTSSANLTGKPVRLRSAGGNASGASSTTSSGV